MNRIKEIVDKMEVLIKRKNVVLDATVLTTLMSCGRLTDFRFNHNFLPMGGKSNSLEVGSLVHKVLEVYYQEVIKGFNRSQAIAAGLTAGLLYAQGCRHCQDFTPSFLIIDGIPSKTPSVSKPKCGHHPNEYPGLSNTPTDSETKPYKRIGYKWALETCEEYFDYWKNDSWVPLEVEVVKRKTLFTDDEIRIGWKAKIDVIQDTNSGIYSVDHKTMQQNRPTFSLNNQFIGQCLVMGTRSTIINKIGFQTSLKPEERFKREMVSYSPERLLEWQSETLPYWSYQLLMYEETGHWPPNLTHCENKFGQCVFVKICEADPEMREVKLREDFIVGEKWDPVNV